MTTKEITRNTAVERYTKDWPVIWRVVAPAAGSYDHDMVFLETESREEAIKFFRTSRRSGYPVRVEKVCCGPLPQDYECALTKWRNLNAQNPGSAMRRIPAAWSKQKSAAGSAS